MVALANEENGKQSNSNPDNTKEGIDGKDILNNGWSCIDVAVYPGPGKDSNFLIVCLVQIMPDD
ncbi:hypothetical protein [Escherichia coli]|uniref:hypothetical protein n=1 Tax=Escherichia coli TaxID=562 RepID=UPI003305B396